MKKKLFCIFMLFYSFICMAQDTWKVEGFDVEVGIKSICKECRLISIDEIDKTMLKWYKENRSEIKEPGMVKADFNGDGIDDYCLLVKNPKKIDSNYYNLYTVVFLSKKDVFRRIFIEKVEIGEEIYWFIEKLIGKKWGIEFKNPAVIFAPFEKDSYILYWDKLKYDFAWQGLE